MCCESLKNHKKNFAKRKSNSITAIKDNKIVDSTLLNLYNCIIILNCVFRQIPQYMNRQSELSD